MRFLLIRHSLTEQNKHIPIPQWGLSPEGIEKATALARSNEVKSLDCIYSSLQTKAIETMLYLAKDNALLMRTHVGLDEISSFTREFFGDDYTQRVHEFYNEDVDRIAEGETWKEALKRFQATLEAIRAREQHLGHSQIGIVTHGNILAYFSALYSEYTPLQLHDRIKMPSRLSLIGQLNPLLHFGATTVYKISRVGN